MIELLDGQQFKDMIVGAAATLEKNKDALDALNVFPVPDGDTGTNMSLTMISAAKEVAAADPSDMKAIVQALSLGALKGARGNSGVILSQIFAGVADTLSKADGKIDTSIFAAAFRNGVDYAYKAVMKPKEGTILTVATKMAEAAELMAEKSDDLYAQLEYVIQEGEKALKETPEQLPVLKEAGVVDAGGAGFLAIIMGLKAVLDGVEVDSENILDSDGVVVDFTNLDAGTEDIQFGYCTEFFIKNLYPEVKERDIDTYRNNLSKIGDCVLVVGDLTLVKTHVHTNEPGLALQYAQILGELSHIKIDNMREQHRELSELAPDINVAEQKELKQIAVVAVTAGDGIKTIFQDWQIEAFVEGGQSMNPSTDDILRAVEEAPSNNVIVLPNNKNIILAAEQAAEMSEKNVVVLKTKSIPQGIAAAVAYDPEADLEANVKRMDRVISEVKTGLITHAVRDTKINGNSIKRDDLIGISESDIVANGTDLKDVFASLLGKMADKDSELITIYYGEDANEGQANELEELCGEAFTDCDVEVHYGGQPVYPYIISVE
ncbi:DAK2 domain-containing protein [Christensenella tenuis]|nr:DAK2 domain-containing protein [Christensenella tenuis]